MVTQQLKAKLGAEFKQPAVLSQLGIEWTALPDATKAEFKSMAKSDKARYDAAFAANPANASIKLKRGGGTTRPNAPSSQGGRQQNAAVSSPRRASLHEMDAEAPRQPKDDAHEAAICHETRSEQSSLGGDASATGAKQSGFALAKRKYVVQSDSEDEEDKPPLSAVGEQDGGEAAGEQTDGEVEEVE
jgi:hypothetical protein